MNEPRLIVSALILDQEVSLFLELFVIQFLTFL